VTTETRGVAAAVAWGVGADVASAPDCDPLVPDATSRLLFAAAVVAVATAWTLLPVSDVVVAVPWAIAP